MITIVINTGIRNIAEDYTVFQFLYCTGCKGSTVRTVLLYKGRKRFKCKKMNHRGTVNYCKVMCLCFNSTVLYSTAITVLPAVLWTRPTRAVVPYLFLDSLGIFLLSRRGGIV